MKNLIILLFCIMLISAACSDDNNNCHSCIKIVNKSSTSIYYYESLHYPDTSINNYNPSKAGSFFKVESNSTNDDITSSCFEADFRINPYGKIIYFIYDAHTIETVPWDTIKKKYMILKRYDLSLDDLNKMNWTITYP